MKKSREVQSPFQALLENLGYKSYEQYLNSPHWKAFRESYRKAKPSIACVVCGSTQKVHFHHNNYDNLGCELESDITLLCEYHHDQVHACLLQKRWPLLHTQQAINWIQSGITFDTSILKKNKKAKQPKKKSKRKSKDPSKIKICHPPQKPPRDCLSDLDQNQIDMRKIIRGIR